MGWKSTIDITREEAISAIMSQMNTLQDKTDVELAQMLYELGFGDDTDKKWFGHNFSIIEDNEL